MATIKPALKPGQTNQHGEAVIYLRLTHRRRSRFIHLGVRVNPRHWNDRKGRVRKAHPNADALNTLIDQRLVETEQAVIELAALQASFTVDDLHSALSAPEEAEAETDFFVFADHLIDDLERRGQVYTYKRYKSICKKLRAYIGELLPFETITPKLLREYETHLIEHYGNSANTVRTNFNALRSIFYKAIREGHAEQSANPFFQFTPIKQTRPGRGKLTLEELRAIEALPLKEGSLIWHVRNYFLFSFYCAGIRFGDLAKMTWEEITPEGADVRLAYRMSKTGTRKVIKLLPQARAILDRYPKRPSSPYLFPILERYDTSTPKKLVSAVSAQNALINKYLKKIAVQAGIETKLSFHIARHSFADIARQKGWDVYTISKALGHANIKVTESYLKGFDEAGLDEKMDELFGS